MTLYMIVCFLRLDARAMERLPFFLIYVLAPVVVLAVDGGGSQACERLTWNIRLLRFRLRRLQVTLSAAKVGTRVGN